MSEAQRPAGRLPAGAGIYTDTLARLYVQQGFFDQALEIYHQLAHTQPQNRQWRERIAALEQQRAAAAGAAGGESRKTAPTGQHGAAPCRHLDRRLLAQLEQWLSVLRQRRMT
jgi:hypothetical protein